MSKIKFLHVSSFYREYLNFLYQSRPDLAGKKYDDQIVEIMADRFAWSDVWKRTLEGTGKFLVEQVLANARPLQLRWAQENNFTFDAQKWDSAILLEQIVRFAPDVIFADDATIVNNSFREMIRAACPSVKTIIGWDGLNNRNVEQYRGCDWVLATMPDLAQYYNDHGSRGFLFRPGFDDSVLQSVQKRAPVYDLSFVGSVSLFKHGHGQRLRTLAQLNRRVAMDLWITGDVGHRVFSRSRLSLLAHGRFRDVANLMSLSRGNRGLAYGIKMYQILADSKITFNCHIDAAGAQAANMRLYEATGIGTCLLTDWKENLSDVFDTEREVVTYRTIDECVEKVKFLTLNPTERDKIALAGQRRTMKDHKLSDRVLEFVDALSKSL